MSPTRKRLWFLVQLILATAILAYVSRHFLNLLGNQSLSIHQLGDRAWYLVPAGLLYLLAHTLFGSFWWLLLKQSKIVIPWHHGVRTYFISQFGKYLPGKAWVLLLRMGMMRNVPIASPQVVGLTGMYETLTTMAAGAILAAVFLPLSGLGGRSVSGHGWILASIAALPLGLFLLIRLLNRIARLRKGPNAQAVLNSPLWLLALGLVQASLGWFFLTLSFRCVAAAVVPNLEPFTLDEFLRDLVCTSAAYVVGFIVVVSPGGLGPREMVLVELLRPRLASLADGATHADSHAVLIAVLLRLVWTAFEVALASGWFLLSRLRTRTHTRTPHP
jgi:glycosyltransferase 2 family protein